MRDEHYKLDGNERNETVTPEQKRHITDIQLEFDELSSRKYRKGVEEHGGNLWEAAPLTLLDFAIDEAIDQVVYLLTLRKKLLGGPK